MNKRSIVLILLAGIILIGIFFFDFTEEKRIPEQGIYWIGQNSYYAVLPKTEITLGIDCFSVEASSDNKLDDLSEIMLLDDSGNAIKIYNNYETVGVCCEGELDSDFLVNRYVLNCSFIVAETTTITHIQYVENDNVITKEIGKIEIECAEGTKDINALQNKISWISFTQPAFKNTEYILENMTENDIKVLDVSYGNSGITFENFNVFEIESQKEKNVKLKISVNEKEGVPIVYYLKPIVIYEIEGKKEQVLFENISKESFFGEFESIKEYLYQISKENDI